MRTCVDTIYCFHAHRTSATSVLLLADWARVTVQVQKLSTKQVFAPLMPPWLRCSFIGSWVLRRSSTLTASPALFVWTAGDSAEVGGGGHPLHDGVFVPAVCIQSQLLRDLIHTHQLTCRRASRALVKLGSWWSQLSQRGNSLQCCFTY